MRFSHDCDHTVHKTTSLWFVLHHDMIYLAEEGEQRRIPVQATPPVSATDSVYSRCIGNYDGQPCMVLELRQQDTDTPLTGVALREAHASIGEELWTIAGRASQILRWRRDHRFCGRCGTEMTEDSRELLRRCPACDFFTHPRISPAVIMSVVKGDAILLGRAPRFPPGMYSVLAGFVEPGETLEQAVAREVREEVDIGITDIRYVGSQPWPFPHSLMIGFTARYASGTIQVDNRELEDAGWFSAANMPRLPSRLSIARRLIETFLADNGGEKRQTP